MNGQINMMESIRRCDGLTRSHFKMMLDWQGWGSLCHVIKIPYYRGRLSIRLPVCLPETLQYWVQMAKRIVEICSPTRLLLGCYKTVKQQATAFESYLSNLAIDSHVSWGHLRQTYCQHSLH